MRALAQTAPKIEGRTKCRSRGLRWRSSPSAPEGSDAAQQQTHLKGLGPDLGSWRLHDLRRTVATGMAEIGVAPHMVEAVLNHVSGHKAGLRTYNRARYADEVRDALNKWAAHVEALVE